MTAHLIKEIANQAELFPSKFDDLFGQAIISGCQKYLEKLQNPDLDKLKESATGIIFNIDMIYKCLELIAEAKCEDEKDMLRRYIDGSKENLTKLIDYVY